MESDPESVDLEADVIAFVLCDAAADGAQNRIGSTICESAEILHRDTFSDEEQPKLGT
ncbi:hypothetical protein J7E83_20970 [Arthrobacter sp. ISL-48]|uniref:hypothetical protein n=1 Tax=Arthrobacter sp. ISL-48 TaxID=2819110 RepID=UPI001BECBFBF|nr:hypothetical protein [Arthrobacter sp. ISL-48]MBT2534555.1 hypothetical protein [Arthrobacter sp. ISL-48]